MATYNPTRLLLFIFLFLILILFSACASNALILQTKVNDPIMMNLLDMNADLSQIEDGTGIIGEATACPT